MDTFANGKITIADDGTFTAGKLIAFPDGSIQVGEALKIDPNGIMTLDGAEFEIQSGYNLVFSPGGGPVVLSPNGSRWKLTVDDSGTVVPVPA